MPHVRAGGRQSGAGAAQRGRLGRVSARPRPRQWLVAAIDDLVRDGGARAAFVLDDGGAVVLARGDFATQVLYPPPPEALDSGWTSVRSGSGELLVFVSVERGATLGGVFDASMNVHLARDLLERTVAAAKTLQ